MLQSEMWIQKVCKLWETDGSHILHLCFDNILNMIQMYYLIEIRFSQLFAQIFFFFFKPTYIQLLIEKSMVEAIVKMFLFFKWRVWSLFWCTACSDIHMTQCSGGQDIQVKIIKTLAAKELKAFLWFLKKLSWCSLILYALDVQNIHVSHQLII